MSEPISETVILSGPGGTYEADRDVCRFRSLTERDLAVYLSLVELVAEKLRHEKFLRQSGIRLVTAAASEPQP